MARANLNKSENFVTNTIAASKYIPNVLGSSSIWNLEYLFVLIFSTAPA